MPDGALTNGALSTTGYTPSQDNAQGIPTIGAPTVDLTAGYVQLIGSPYTTYQKPSLADGVLNIDAQWIDIGSADTGSIIVLQGVDEANFDSSNAIRT